MKPKYNRSAIMRRAHHLKKANAVPFGAALRQAWAEAKSPKAIVAVQPRLVLPPLVSAAKGAVSLAKKLRTSRIQVGLRVQLDAAVRVTPRGEDAMSWATSKHAALVVDHLPAAPAAIEHRAG